MFSIHISEKSGVSRSETFDTAEINIGRVQGNDLMLPRGNVSKHHARFVHRDGRFIVTDLKSTNGTYVNGRRIAQATLVREGDTIHIGDFVLRLGSVSDSPATLPPAAPLPSKTMGFTDASPTSKSPSPPSMRPHPSRISSSRAPRPLSTHPTQPPSEHAFSAGHGRALALLSSRLSERVDLSLLDEGAPLDEAFLNRLSRIIAELSRKLREDGEIPGAIDDAVLSRDAHRELLHFGPVGPLLDDDSISEIQVIGHERIVVTRGSQTSVIEPAFSSEAALLRTISRLVRESGRALLPDETTVERLLPTGVFLHAVLRPVALSGDVLVLRKPQQRELDVESLVREEKLSPSMATFLTQALAARANLLIVDASGEVGASLGALGLRDDSRFVALHAPGMPGMAPEGAFSMALPDGEGEAAKVVRAALRLRPERLLVLPLGASVASELLDGIAEGAEGIAAVVRARSLHLGLERLALEVAKSRPGLSSRIARESIAASFDLVVEVAKLRDGRHRVLRIGELLASKTAPLEVRDVFTFSIERIDEASFDIEGSFEATGNIPRLAEELAAREGGIDLSLFRRRGGSD